MGDFLKIYKTFDFPKAEFILPQVYNTNSNSGIFVPAYSVCISKLFSSTVKLKSILSRALKLVDR